MMILLSIKDYLFIDKDEVAFIFNRRSAQIPNLCSYLNKRKACKFEFAGFHFQEIAERQGFEPWEQLPVHRISSAARSTTLASFLNVRKSIDYRSIIYFCKGSIFCCYLEFFYSFFVYSSE